MPQLHLIWNLSSYMLTISLQTCNLLTKSSDVSYTFIKTWLSHNTNAKEYVQTCVRFFLYSYFLDAWWNAKMWLHTQKDLNLLSGLLEQDKVHWPSMLFKLPPLFLITQNYASTSSIITPHDRLLTFPSPFWLCSLLSDTPQHSVKNLVERLEGQSKQQTSNPSTNGEIRTNNNVGRSESFNVSSMRVR